MPQDHLLGDEPGLDGLAEADVVGDEQVDARHLDRAHDRLQVVVLDADAAAEGRLQRVRVRRGDRAPAHGVEEGVQRGGVVEAVGWERQVPALANAGPRLDLPDDAQPVAERVILDG